MIFITQCDSPALWQTYLSDPASITMEGILIFNKHLLMLTLIFGGLILLSKETGKSDSKDEKKPQVEQEAPVTPPQSPGTQPTSPPQIQPGEQELIEDLERFPKFRVGEPSGVEEFIPSSLYPKPKNPSTFDKPKGGG